MATTAARAAAPERPRLPPAAAAAGPPVAGEDPGGAFPGWARLAGEAGPGSRPRPPPSRRWPALFDDTVVARARLRWWYRLRMRGHADHPGDRVVPLSVPDGVVARLSARHRSNAS